MFDPKENATKPAPLTDADCDLRNFPYMPLDVMRLRDSDAAVILTADEFRAALLLWCAAWHQVPAASLPADDRLLAKFAGFGREVTGWQTVRCGALRGFIECCDGRLYHPVVAEKAREAWEKKFDRPDRAAARSEHARKAADARWHEQARAKTRNNGQDPCAADAQAPTEHEGGRPMSGGEKIDGADFSAQSLPGHMLEQCPKDALKRTEGKRRERKRRERKIDDDGGGGGDARARELPAAVEVNLIAPALFHRFSQIYPGPISPKSTTRAKFVALLRAGEDADAINAAAANAAPDMQADQWLAEEGWKQCVSGIAPPKSEPMISTEARALAGEIAAIAGHDIQCLDTNWKSAPHCVQQWLSRGWHRDLILVSVRSQVARKRGEKIRTIDYFEKGIASVIAGLNTPLPSVTHHGFYSAGQRAPTTKG